VNLPPTLLSNLHDVHDDAAAWLGHFDTHLRACEARWNVRVTGLVPQLSYNVVLYAEGVDGAPYVLKMSPPSDELTREAVALRLYDGDGICRLVRADVNVGALLLERLEPGHTLWNTEDDEAATRTVAALMKRLWRTVPNLEDFRTLDSWLRALYAYHRHGRGGPLPHDLVDRAVHFYEELRGAEPVLLHADLHHGNILTSDREPYLAIDPKGIVGPRGYDVGPFLMNPTPDLSRRPDLERILERRVADLSEMLALSTQEVAAWGVVHAVLSACWSLESHGGGWESALAVARVLAKG